MGDGPKLDPADLNSSFLSAAALDKSGKGALALSKVANGKPLWAGETAAANNGGQSGITDSYVDGFWYLDQLGSLAQAGVQVFCRQTLESSGGYPLLEKYLPLPDYWVALLWSRLMGSTVLSTQSNNISVRVYAHCTRGVPGGVTLAWMNLGAEREIDAHELGEAEMWVLTPGKKMHRAVSGLQSQQVLLNGKLVELRPGPSLPDLDGVVAARLVLPRATYGFAAQTCQGHGVYVTI